MTTINIRVDEDVKKQATELFSDLGLDMSTAVNMFLRQALIHDGLPFEATRERPNAETLAAIKEVREMKAHPEKYKRYNNMDDLWVALEE